MSARANVGPRSMDGSNRRVVVVGAGVAGLAAAWSLTRAGLRPTIVSSGIGASALSGGAVDDVPWEEWARAVRLVRSNRLDAPVPPPEVLAFSNDLGLWRWPNEGRSRALLASISGRLRPARAHDRGLLDFSSLRNGVVVIPRAPREGWDAHALAVSLGADASAKEQGLRFVAVDHPVLHREEERRIPDADLAARHDDEARAAWLERRLREIAGRHQSIAAILLGPWLGVSAPLAERLTQSVGIPVGELIAARAGTAGLRFERTRDRFLDQLGCVVLHDRVNAIAARRGVLAIQLERAEALEADAVVLAIGGIAGGGIVYDPPERAGEVEGPSRGRAAFRLSLRADVELAAFGRAEDVGSSLHGPDLDETAWPSATTDGVLERIGVRANGVMAARRVAVAGDALADRPRTVVEAVASGIAAGEWAANERR